MKRLFITGRSGFLGSKFTKIAGNYEVINIFNTNIQQNAIKLDITDKEDAFSKIKSLEPDVVIHSAALTNVDYCEDHHEEAYQINAREL